MISGPLSNGPRSVLKNGKCDRAYHDVPLRGRDSMSKVGGGGGMRSSRSWGLLLIYIHSEYIHHRLLVFNMFFMTTSNFGGAQPPLSKSGGPRLPPQVLCLCPWAHCH